LPAQRKRVYRLKSDDSRPRLSRQIHREERGAVLGRFGQNGAKPLTPAEFWAAVMARGTTIQLALGRQVSSADRGRSRFMGDDGLERVSSADTAVDVLKALGCITEIAMIGRPGHDPVQGETLVLIGPRVYAPNAV
jgi:hypothetical protein